MTKGKKDDNYKLNHLINSIRRIINNSEFAHFPDSNRFLSVALDRLERKPKREWQVDFPQIEIPINDENLKDHNPSFLIGGIISGVGSDITFSSLSICITFQTNPSHRYTTSSCCLINHPNSKRIVRRFHFDYQPKSSAIPKSHFQYGGIFPKTEQYKEYHYCLEDFLEKPRFHYPPMDLVLLFDLIINEFSTPLKRWTQETFWRSLVFQSQKLWWAEYRDLFSDCINNSTGKTFHEAIYCGNNE